MIINIGESPGRRACSSTVLAGSGREQGLGGRLAGQQASTGLCRLGLHCLPPVGRWSVRRVRGRVVLVGGQVAGQVGLVGWCWSVDQWSDKTDLVPPPCVPCERACVRVDRRGRGPDPGGSDKTDLDPGGGGGGPPAGPCRRQVLYPLCRNLGVYYWVVL